MEEREHDQRGDGESDGEELRRGHLPQYHPGDREARPPGHRNREQPGRAPGRRCGSRSPGPCFRSVPGRSRAGRCRCPRCLSPRATPDPIASVLDTGQEDRVGPEEDAEFAAYVAARRGVVRRTAYLLCNDWHRADDLTQIAFVKLYGAWQRIRDRGALDAYVRSCLVRAVVDESRRPWRRERAVEAVPDTPAPSDTASTVADRELVRTGARTGPAGTTDRVGTEVFRRAGRGGGRSRPRLFGRKREVADRARAGRAEGGAGRAGLDRPAAG